MKQTYCNPLDLGYRYQHMKEGPRTAGFREGADPTLVYFKGKYYLFVSMSAGFWYSEDLLDWNFHADPDLLIYDYAPDVRQVGDYLYFCASRKGRNCPILRTTDPLTEPFTEVSAPFAFWDPDLFCDDDGRVYFYWGCSNVAPIYGVELDPDTMIPIGEKQELIFGNETALGYERPGNNGIVDREASVLYQSMKQFYDPKTGKLNLPPQMANIPGLSAESLTAMFNAIGKPYIEGAFMTKHDGLYYLQYACPGTQYNTYADGVYTSVLRLAPLCGRHPTRSPQSPVDSSPAQATAAPLPTAMAIGGTPLPCAFPSTMTLSAGWGCSLPGSTRTACFTATRTLPITPTASHLANLMPPASSRNGCC